MVFAQKPLLRHELVKCFLSSTVVFAIYLRPRAIYLRPCTFVYVLDPHYLGIDMTPDQRIEVEEMIYSHPTLGRNLTTELQDAMVVEYTNFKIAALEMRRSGSRLFCSLTAKSMSVLMFWMSHCGPWPTLQILAKQVFSMVAASERNFSAFAFVRTKQRNCLSETSIKKLVYVRTNNLPFTKQQGVAAAFSNDDDITHSDADY